MPINLSELNSEDVLFIANNRFKNVVTNTVTIKSSTGFLSHVIVNKVTQTTIRIYDTTTILSTRTAVMRNTVSNVVVPAGNTQFLVLPYNIRFTRGLRVLITTASDLTFSFK